jgi:hypothetical protein
MPPTHAPTVNIVMPLPTYDGFVDRCGQASRDVTFIRHKRAKSLFELVKANDLEELVAKRKDGRYHPAARWFKVLNPTYTQKVGRQDFFERN